MDWAERLPTEYEVWGNTYRPSPEALALIADWYGELEGIDFDGPDGVGEAGAAALRALSAKTLAVVTLGLPEAGDVRREVLGLRYGVGPGQLRFMNYFALVQTEALTRDRIFFYDTACGHSLATDAYELDDLDGWLVAPQDAGRFRRAYAEGGYEAVEDFAGCSCHVTWSLDASGEPTVSLETDQ